MISRLLVLSFILIFIFACHPKQASLQRTSFQEYEQNSIPKRQVEFLNAKVLNLNKIKDRLYEKIKVDTMDIKPDTIPLSKEKIFIPADTLVPKAANIDSIIVKNESSIIQAKADKLAKQSYNLGFAAIVGVVVFWPLSLILASIAIGIGRKSLKLETQTPQKAKDGIKMGKLALLFLLVASILAILIVLLIVSAFSNSSFR